MGAPSYSLKDSWEWFRAFSDKHARATEAVLDYLGISQTTVAFWAARDQSAWCRFKNFVKAADRLFERAERGRADLCKIEALRIIETLISTKSKYLTALGLDATRERLLSWKSTHKRECRSEVTNDGTQLLLDFGG